MGCHQGQGYLFAKPMSPELVRGVRDAAKYLATCVTYVTYLPMDTSCKD
jgi:hypothetical protein